MSGHAVHAERFARPRGVALLLVIGVFWIADSMQTDGGKFATLRNAQNVLVQSAVVLVTGIRNPCKQLDRFQSGLTSAMLGRDADGNITRKSGIMSVVLTGGEVRPGDAIVAELPPEPHQPLGRV